MLFRSRKINELARLNTISVPINSSNTFPDRRLFVNNIGMCRIKNKILAINEDVKILFDCSYSLFRMNPRDNISSEIAVARASAKITANFLPSVAKSVDPNDIVPCLM